MAKTGDLNTVAPATDDKVVLTDVSDTSVNPSGATRNATIQSIIDLLAPPSGDMQKATYDPNTVEADAFGMDNMVEGTDTKILTASERTKLSNVREALTANRTYYVATTGSDSNDGLSSGSPFLTVQHAVDTALGLDMGIYSVTINVAAGTYAEGTALNINGNGNARITIAGDAYNTTKIGGSTFGFVFRDIAFVTLQDMEIGGSVTCVTADDAARVRLSGTVMFSDASVASISVNNNATVTCIGTTLRLNVDSNTFISVTNGGRVSISTSATIITQAARTFAVAVVLAQTGGGATIFSSQVTWDETAGTITGRRYNVSINALINTGGGGATFIPGTIAGVEATGGVYA